MFSTFCSRTRIATPFSLVIVCLIPTGIFAADSTSSTSQIDTTDAGTSVTMQDAWTSRTQAVLTSIGKDVWIHRSWFRFPNGDTYFSNGLIVKSPDDNSAVLVDTAWGTESTENLLKQIREDLGLRITAAIVTHWHADKTAGVDILKARGIPVYALPETIKLCQENGKPVPDHPIAGLDKPGTTATVAGLEIMYPGRAHASDNILVWEPRNKVLLGGCAVRAATDTSPGNLSDADLKEWPASMRRAEAAYGDRAKIVIPGHGEPTDSDVLEYTAKLAEKFYKIRSAGKKADD